MSKTVRQKTVMANEKLCESLSKNICLNMSHRILIAENLTTEFTKNLGSNFFLGITFEDNCQSIIIFNR